MIEIWCVEASARPAGTAIRTAARIAAPSSPAARGRARRIYLTVTFTVRLDTVEPCGGLTCPWLSSGSRFG